MDRSCGHGAHPWRPRVKAVLRPYKTGGEGRGMGFGESKPAPFQKAKGCGTQRPVGSLKFVARVLFRRGSAGLPKIGVEG
jgi:hypothetical protein